MASPPIEALERRNPAEDRSFFIGLTGGIASGKSTVARLFRKLGIDIIETDLIARAVVAPGRPLLRTIVTRFGNEVLTPNGSLDRPKLRALVFADATSRAWLEATVHPEIIRSLWRQARAAKSPYCILDIPLLIETDMTHQVDRVLVIDADEALQRKRLRQRDGTSDEQIDAMLQAQASRQSRLAVADDVIENNAEPGCLDMQAIRLHERYLVMANTKAAEKI